MWALYFKYISRIRHKRDHSQFFTFEVLYRPICSGSKTQEKWQQCFWFSMKHNFYYKVFPLNTFTPNILFHKMYSNPLKDATWETVITLMSSFEMFLIIATTLTLDNEKFQNITSTNWSPQSQCPPPSCNKTSCISGYQILFLKTN